ncbi:MAG: LytTR family DNA-binding domain-containing protein [Bacteroidales bacterium]|nr:LytTR family DNA-binding domain-containing protein [Bacteroidales bacterium]
MKIGAIIIDDEKHCRENLANLLEKNCPAIDILGFGNSALEGLHLIKEFKPDVVFLDVEMPGGDAFKMLELVDEPNFEIVFVTAFDHYALKAIKFSALDYILKPINPDDLKCAVKKTIQTIELKSKNKRLLSLKDNLQYNKPSKIALPTRNETEFIPIDAIVFVKGEDNYSHFFLTDGRKIMVSRTLSEFDELLGDSFFIRTHKGFLVNLHQVRKVLNQDGGVLLMHNEIEIPIARRRRELVKEKLDAIVRKS